MMSVMLFKLSLRNARRQARDYLIYFATVILAAALLYAFNGLVFSEEIRVLSSGLAMLPMMIVLASAVVVCIFGWLVSYATNFMLTRRSRELGLYVLIGLENEQVARLFFLENLAVGGAALAFGLLLGNLLFQVFRAVVLALFRQPYHFAFAFSLKALGLTAVYFVLIYMYALRRSRKKIRTMKIHDLIYFDRKNEGAVIQTGRKRRWVFTASIVLGILGTSLMIVGGALFGIIGAGCIIVFLYGFFLSFASGVSAFFDRHPAREFKGQNLLVFRTLTAKLGTMGVVMATISLLLTATLVSEGTGLIFRGILDGRAAQEGCFDLYIASGYGIGEEYLDYIEEKIPVEKSVLYPIYHCEDSALLDYVRENTDDIYFQGEISVIGLRDYNALRSIAGFREVEDAAGQYLVHCMGNLYKALKNYGQAVTVGGVRLDFGGIYREAFMQQHWELGNGQGYLLVVPDEVVEGTGLAGGAAAGEGFAGAEGLAVHHWAYAAKTKKPVGEEMVAALENIGDGLEKERQGDGSGADGNDEMFLIRSDVIHSRAAEEAEAASMTALTVFPLYFLALALLMTTATILTIWQLSESAHYRQQFMLLEKLGMERREMGRTLRLQFAIYYAMPAVPPVLVGVPFIRNLAGATDPGILSGASSPAAIIKTALGVFFLIYAVYILLAYVSLRRDVLPE